MINQPFVYLIDSPSHNDLTDGYSIGMALRDALRAIKIPCFYTLTTNTNNFFSTLQHRIPAAIQQIQPYQGNINALPFVHLCMHGMENGIGLTDNSFVNWFDLKNALLNCKIIKGHDPYLCMASCNGFNAINMATAYDPAFSALIGNTGAVLQSDVTVAYMSFYNHLFYKNATIEQAVIAMRQASGDHNFYYTFGEQVRTQRFVEMQNQYNPQINNFNFPY